MASSNFSSPSISIPAFNGGINEALDETLIKQNEASAAQNVDIYNGVFSTKGGYSKLVNVVSLHNIKTIMTYYFTTGCNLLFAGDNEITLFKASDSSKVDLYSTTNDYFDSVNFKYNSKDVLVLGNGVDPTLIYDGSIIRKLLNRRKTYDPKTGNLTGYTDANGVLHVNESDVTTYAPKGKYIETHYQRTWISGDSDNQDRVYFSTADVQGFDCEDWTAPTEEGEANQHGGFIDVVTNDGGHIIGLKVLLNDVVVFKNHNIFKIYGNYPGNYMMVQVFSSNGGIADKSIVAANGMSYFLSKEGIFVYDGTNVKPVHQRIKNTFESLNKDYFYNAQGIFYKNKYILAVPEGNSIDNNLIIEYDVLNNNFMFIRGVNVKSFAIYNDNLVFVNNTNQVYQYESGNDFDGAKIVSYWNSSTSTFKNSNAIKNTNYLYFLGSGNGSVKFTCYTERSSNKSVTVALTNIEKPYRVKLKNKGRMLQLKVENVDGSSITIKQPELFMDVDYD